MATFKAIVIHKTDAGQGVGLEDFDENDLMEGDVTVRVAWSTVNYKDGLAITGKAPVVRRFPMIPGIDLAGTVEASTHPDWKPGDQVILNGWGVGETHLGAYGAKARLKGDWLVRLPAGISARDAMAIGTAGYTAMLAVMALEHQGLKPAAGPVVVTGAAGGVGSVAVAILAKLGFKVTASTGRPQRRTISGGSAPPRSSIARSWRAPAPCQGALRRRYRRGGLDHPRQCAVDDSLPRGSGGMRPGGRYGYAGERRAVHFARSVTFGHRFGHAAAGGSAGSRGRLAADLDRQNSLEMTSEELACPRHRGRPGNRRGPGPGSIVVKIG